MTETAQPKRGGKAFHSILELHFDYIRELRQRRKNWKEIAADLLFNEKGVRLTLYAPYRFYQRQLKRRAKEHWEDKGKNSQCLRPPEPSGQPAAITSSTFAATKLFQPSETFKH